MAPCPHLYGTVREIRGGGRPSKQPGNRVRRISAADYRLERLYQAPKEEIKFNYAYLPLASVHSG